MKSKELVIKTLSFESPARIPRQCWVLPWAENQHPDEVAALNEKYPDDIIPVAGMYKKTPVISGSRYKAGKYIDEWGCIFNNIHEGLIGVPSEPLIRSWDLLDDFKTPEDMLNVDVQQVNAFCKTTEKFTYSSSWIRPFERYQFIRTTGLAMIDIALDEPDMTILIDKIHSHYLKEAAAWSKTSVDAIGIMDDWGMQKGMIVSPVFFRKYYKQQYSEYAEIAHHHGKYVFMHSDGNITEIIPDLIEIGIDALNSQLFCMNIKELGKEYRGKITFWGEIDRQRLLREGTKKEIEDAVQLVYENLYADGGVIAECEFGPAAKPGNIFSVFESWEKISNKIKS